MESSGCALQIFMLVTNALSLVLMFWLGHVILGSVFFAFTLFVAFTSVAIGWIKSKVFSRFGRKE